MEEKLANDNNKDKDDASDRDPDDDYPKALLSKEGVVLILPFEMRRLFVLAHCLQCQLSCQFFLMTWSNVL